MKRGHVTGSKRERKGTDWYKTIEAAHLKRIEAAVAGKAARQVKVDR